MQAQQDDWATSLESMWSTWDPPVPDSVVERVGAIVTDLVTVVAMLYRGAPEFDQACRDYVEMSLGLGRPGWAAAGRAVWAMGLWRDGDEDSAQVQMVLAELELQHEVRHPQPDPVGGPTAVAAASNNLGLAFATMRMLELAHPHLLAAARISEQRYGPELRLQMMADRSNLAEVKTRWALHAESVGRHQEARQRARRAITHGKRFEQTALEMARSDALGYAQALIIGARSVAEPESVTDEDWELLRSVAAEPVFGDEPSAVVVWAILTRVSRLTGHDNSCREAAEQTAALSFTGDQLTVAVALREAALLEPQGEFTRQYLEAISGQAEVARRRAVAGFRTRLLLAGFEQRYEQVRADRRRLQQLLERAERGEAELLHAATHDELTGLPNRALFGQRLDAGLSACRAGESDLALAFIDLDDLKGINDDHGHPVGDRVLREVGKTLLDTSPQGATVARISGDEFAVLVTGRVDPTTIQQWADRINQHLPTHEGPGRIGVSVGVCLLKAGSEVEAEELIRVADEQMYASKRAGKGRAHLTVLSN